MSDNRKNNKNSDEISLKELIEMVQRLYRYLLTQWKLIVLAGIVGVVLGLTYSFMSKPKYTATLSFALEDEKAAGGGLGGALGLASSFGFDLGGSGGGMFSGSNLTELFKSRKMVVETLLVPIIINGKQTTLAEEFIKICEWREDWGEKPKLKNIRFLPNADRAKFSREQDSILGVIHEKLSKEGLSVGQKDKKISIISLDMVSTNELFAKNFCEALARQVGVFYVTTKSKKARINLDILQRQMDSIRGSLNGAITGVAVATDNTFGLNPAMNVRRVPSSRKQVDVQANTAILTELVKQTELAKVALRKETPLIQVIDRPVLPLKKEKVGKIKGLVLGGFLGGFLMCVFLIMRKILKSIKGLLNN